jgi:hypothetical protein
MPFRIELCMMLYRFYEQILPRIRYEDIPVVEAFDAAILKLFDSLIE